MLLCRAQRASEADAIQQLRERGMEMERTMEDKERELSSLAEERDGHRQQLEEVSRSQPGVMWLSHSPAPVSCVLGP